MAQSVEERIATEIAQYVYDPLGFARLAYPWGEAGELKSYSGLRVWQSDILSVIREHLRSPQRYDPLRIAVAAGHGVGKALRPDDTVPTPDGFRRVRDICPGDKLFGERGQVAKVLAVRTWSACPFYRVRFTDGTSVEVSSGHLWKVKGRNERRRGLDWKILSTEDIVRRGVRRPNGVSMTLQWEVPRSGAVGYLRKDLPIDPYTYGVWLGDGDKRGGRITNVDQEVWDNVAFPHRGHGKTRTLFGMKVALRSAGLLGCTTYNASVDRRYMESAQRLDVLQGLLDTDGWVEHSGGAAFASVSKQLTEDVIEICRSLGLRAREASFQKNDHAGSWRTHITWDGKTQLFRILRKQNRLIAAEKRYTANWIESIEPAEPGAGICFEVEGGLFLTRQFIVTHNSALIAIIADWAMSTCDDCRVMVTANTEDQLVTKTWPEVCKWFGASINRDWWDIGATRITARQKGHAALWRFDRVTWSENNTEAFQGLHNLGKRIVVIFDEASAIPDKIWEVTEGALTDEGTEIIWIAFGNPTQNSGRFRECFGRFAHRWITRHIDSRKVPGTNKEQIAKWIEDFGEDSDFVRVRVRGEFPRAGGLQFIPQDLVAAARKRKCEPSGYKVMAVDVARSGFNQTVVGTRQGQVAKILAKWRGLSIPDQAGKVALLIMEHEPRCVIVDGDGIGGALADDLRRLLPKPNTPRRDWPDTALSRWFAEHPWFSVQEFHGGQPALDKFMYFNRRGEVWGMMKKWLEHGSIDDDPELESHLTGVRYDTDNPKSVIQLERKEDMRDRGVESPDCGDELAMTFAANPMAETRDEKVKREQATIHDPMELHFAKLRETQKREKERQPLNFWE